MVWVSVRAAYLLSFPSIPPFQIIWYDHRNIGSKVKGLDINTYIALSGNALVYLTKHHRRTDGTNLCLILVHRQPTWCTDSHLVKTPNFLTPTFSECSPTLPSSIRLAEALLTGSVQIGPTAALPYAAENRLFSPKFSKNLWRHYCTSQRELWMIIKATEHPCKPATLPTCGYCVLLSVNRTFGQLPHSPPWLDNYRPRMFFPWHLGKFFRGTWCRAWGCKSVSAITSFPIVIPKILGTQIFQWDWEWATGLVV